MKAKTYSLLFGAVAFAFVIGMVGFFADPADASDQTILAKGRGKVDDAPKPHGPLHKFLETGNENISEDLVVAREFEPREPPRGRDPRLQEKTSDEMVLVKRRGKVDDNPKPHGPLHKLIEDSSDGIMLAKNKKPATLPGAPPIDAPIKNAPHAPGAVHG